MTVTLADIERATARRVGPFYLAFADRQQPSTANLETVLVPTLRSNIEQDIAPNLWLLRRGLDYQGNILPISDFDRQRSVSTIEPDRGAVTVDRPWQLPPQSGEVLEFHHLDPTLELREAVRAGLRRCLFEDTYNLGYGYFCEADLTSALPWLDDLNMVKRVQAGGWAGLCSTPQDIPFAAFGRCGHVWIRIGGAGGMGSFYGGVLVTVHRPAFGWVNGTDTCAGPLEDEDTLNVDLDYAAAAAHIEAWHNFPARMFAAAAGGTQATREQAAYEYTRQAYVHRLPRHDRSHFEGWFGASRTVVVNA